MESSLHENWTRRILLVGIDPHQVEGFGAAANGSGEGWSVCSAHTIGDAWALLNDRPFAVIVAKAQLAEGKGVEFLDAVMKRQPEVARVLLSDLASLEATVQCVGTAHHHLLEPSDFFMLRSLLRRASDFQSSLSNSALPALMARIRQLPSPPEIYFQVVEEVQTAEASVDRIGSLIGQDAALSAKVLQLANSAVFGLQLQVAHPVEAVTYLGFETIKALLLLAHTFSFFEDVHSSQFDLPSLRYHAMAVGQYAQRISELEAGFPDVASQAFTAGLLHDIGKLLLAANLPEDYDQALIQSAEENRSLWEVEAQLWGADHAQVGGWVLDTWHLPAPIVEAVTWHHDPGRCPTSPQPFSLLTAVHVANALEHEMRPELLQWNHDSADLDYLIATGCIERLCDWRNTCHAMTAS